MTIRSQGRDPGPRGKTALWALWWALPFLGLAYQVCAKQTAGALADISFGAAWFAQLVRSPWLPGLVALDLLTFTAWMAGPSEIRRSAAFPLLALNYGLVIATSWTFFHEPASVLQVVGAIVILTGVWLIGRSESPETT